MRTDAMKNFIEIADMASMIKVAQNSGIPQQSLSSMIAAMEKELRCKLFRRGNGGLQLTEEGHLFYQYCVDFFREDAQLRNQIAGKDPQTQAMHIRISSQNNMAQTVLPNWLSILLKHYPNLSPTVRIRTMNQVIQDMQNNEADIGFVLRFEHGDMFYPELPEDFVFTPLHYGRPYFWVNKSNPLAQNNALTMKMISHYRIMRDDNGDNELFDYIFQNHFHIEGNYLHVANAHIILHLLQDNLAICPDIKKNRGELGFEYLLGDKDDLVALPLAAKDNYRMTTGYITRKGEDFSILDEIKQFL